MLLDGDGRPVLKFGITSRFFWGLCLVILMFFSWYQVAEDYHRWILSNISSYRTVSTVNQLQKNVLQNIKGQIFGLKKDFLAIKKGAPI